MDDQQPPAPPVPENAPVIKKETEFEIYCKIGNFDGLKEASRVEEQEQLELFVPGKGKVRVRKTTDDTGTRFEAGVKTANKNLQGGGPAARQEEEDPVRSAYFENFRNVADRLLIKTRYIFEGKHTVIEADNKEVALPPMKFEVDVYKRHDGHICEWAKIDVPMDEFLETLKTIPTMDDRQLNFTIKVSHLPFVPQGAFLQGDATDEQRLFLKNLWDKEFSQSPFGGPMVPVQSTVAAPKPPPTTPDPTQQPAEQNSEADNGDTTQNV